MGILFITSIYAPVAGGIAVYVRALAETLVSMGHSVCVFTRLCPGRPTNEVINGVHVSRSPHLHFTDFGKLALDILALNRIHELDLICAVEPKLAWNVASTLAALILRKPRYLLVVGSRNEQTGIVSKWLSGLTAKRILGISKYCLGAYAAWPSRWQLLYPELEVGTEDDVLPFGERENLVLSVGWVHQRKRYEIVLETAALMPDVRFVVVGDTTMRPQYYEKLAARKRQANITNLSFAGVLEREALLSLYRKARCFFLPSAHEMFGLVFLEAMSAGTPVISTRAAAIPEVLGSGGLCYPLDAAAETFAKEIRTLLEDRTVWAQRSVAARQRARTFTRDTALLEALFPLD